MNKLVPFGSLAAMIIGVIVGHYLGLAIMIAGVILVWVWALWEEIVEWFEKAKQDFMAIFSWHA